jgi:hypothetical protein
MNSIPWGTIIIFSLFCVIGIIAFAEGLMRQREMQKAIKELYDSNQEIRDAIKAVSSKAKERISNIEGRLEACSSCPTSDRRAVERRKSNESWMIDSDLNYGNKAKEVNTP